MASDLRRCEASLEGCAPCLARRPYYRWLACPVTTRERAEAYLAKALFDAHHDDPEFGYRLLADAVRAAGNSGCDRRVWRICAANRWWRVFGKKRGTNGKRPGRPAHDDHVRRDFNAAAPNQLWLTRIAVDALTMAVAGEVTWQAASCTATAAVQGGFNLVPPIPPVA